MLYALDWLPTVATVLQVIVALAIGAAMGVGVGALAGCIVLEVTRRREYHG